jgi:formiminotetrahydrofolate cyclodeaminase
LKKLTECVPSFREGKQKEAVDSIASSEIVGLVPQNASDSSADYCRNLENFDRSRILENRSSEVLAREPGLEEFIRCVADTVPLLPGGGSVAALAGSLAAALGEMMSSLTEGRKKFASVDARVREIHQKLTPLRDTLGMLVNEDSEAFKSVMDAIKLPKDNEEQKAARAQAIEKATRLATETPLRTARAAAEVLECLRVLVEVGNPNARCDAATGAQMAQASLKSAQYNILANISKMKDEAFAENSRAEVLALVQRGQAILQEIDLLITGL